MEHRNQTDNGGEVKSLIARAAEGSQDAFEELKGRYKPLIESQVQKHKLYDMTDQDVEDLRQEALVTFCNAVCHYDCESDGVEFGLYAKICLENGLTSFIRSYLRHRKRTVLPLDSTEIPGERTDPLQSLVERENTAALIQTIRDNLSEYENRVWWMYVSGMSVSKISVAIGNADAKSVSNAIYRIRRKLRRYIEAHPNEE